MTLGSEGPGVVFAASLLSLRNLHNDSRLFINVDEASGRLVSPNARFALAKNASPASGASQQ
jgi:hypothetical protein